VGITHASSASSLGGKGKATHIDDKPSVANGGYGAALHRASLDAAQLDSGPESDAGHFEADPPLEPGSDDWALHEPQSEVDKRDIGTPDEWINRHPQLIRLTGRHPFNCEPPPEVLMEKSVALGGYTPTNLHYVRNHGPTPRLDWGGHRVTVEGLVDRPTTFTMDQLISLPSVTIPVTLVCAGNRRKEQNMVKKSKGFNWGPAATGLSRWTGVRLSVLLNHCGIKSPEQGANYISFVGPEKELPQGDTTYGTSITRYKGMDDGNDIIVAYKQNGRWLEPDHGFPVRMIIPGHIGGRMVKWLKKIEVLAGESTNFYHYHDNRVMPSHVDAKMADEQGYWFDPDWIINELNLNSVITSPAHDELITLDSQKTYTLKGYAYSGGTKILRCEVSMDDGTTWTCAKIKRFAPGNAAGKHWAWIHWSLEVPVVDLMKAKEFMCRAWDHTQNSQPAKLTWSLLGMMNNCMYRVKIHPSVAEGGAFALHFEHPTKADGLGGWMNRKEDAEKLAAAEAAQEPAPVKKAGRKITMAEVEKHSTKESVWFVRDGKVYDGTPYLKDHPGGADSIMLTAGADASDEFNAIHSTKAKNMLDDYYIGELDADADLLADGVRDAKGVTAITQMDTDNMVDADGNLVALNPRKRIKFKLIEKENISHNVRRFRFELQSEKHRFGLPVGQHVFLYAKVKGELVVRAYSPISSNDDLGYFELVIKVYWAGQLEAFPDGGKMSQHLESLALGDTIEAKGPMGHITYLSRGRYLLGEDEKVARRWTMLAGGTGITPLWQVLQAILKDPEDRTEVSLIYANQTPDDILLHTQLDDLAAKHDNFRVWYIVSEPKEGQEWAYSLGRITKAIIQEHGFPAGEGSVAGMCGPPGMVNKACIPSLKELGFSDEQCIVF